MLVLIIFTVNSHFEFGDNNFFKSEIFWSNHAYLPQIFELVLTSHVLSEENYWLEKTKASLIANPNLFQSGLSLTSICDNHRYEMW